jgi:serine/threonine protein kinase
MLHVQVRTLLRQQGIVGSDGEVVVGGEGGGHARGADIRERKSSRELHYSTVGTPDYIAPEVIHLDVYIRKWIRVCVYRHIYTCVCVCVCVCVVCVYNYRCL